MEPSRETRVYGTAVEGIARLSRRPAPQEGEHLAVVVMVALFQLGGVLRAQQAAGIIKDKQVREAQYLRIP